MKFKCLKKNNHWEHLGSPLIFYKFYLCQLIKYTAQNSPEPEPHEDWWVIMYAVSSAVDAVNNLFIVLQNRSLLLSQQEHHI